MQGMVSARLGHAPEHDAQLTGSPLSRSPASPRPLLSPASRAETRRALSPISVNAPPRGFALSMDVAEPEFSPGGLSPRPVRRRSVDGGVRVAGGPPGSRAAAASMLDETGSTASTLPPLYQMYPP